MALGQRLLLFVVQAFYAEQARVRGGRPLAGHVGRSFLHRLEGDQVIAATDSAAPETLAELRDLIASDRR